MGMLLMPVALIGVLHYGLIDYVIDTKALTIMCALVGGVWWCLKKKKAQASAQPVCSNSSEPFFQAQRALQPLRRSNSEQATEKSSTPGWFWPVLISAFVLISATAVFFILKRRHKHREQLY